MDNHIGQEILDELDGTAPAAMGERDAFGRLRISSPYSLLDSKLQHDKNPFIWDEVLGGTATSVHSVANACVDMAVNADSDYVIRETKQFYSYQSGKSQYIKMTGIMNPEDGSTKAKIYGSGDTSADYGILEGVGFETIDEVMYIVTYKDGVASRVAQTAWNIDRLDGSKGDLNPSKVTIDWSKAHIFALDTQWLAVGDTLFYIGFDRKLLPIHHVKRGNTLTNAFMQSGSQKVRYELRSTGSTTATMKQICTSIESEGGQEKSGIVVAVDSGATAISITTSLLLVAAVRLNGDLNISAEVLKTSIIGTDNTVNGRWVLLLNPTIGGTPNWQAVTDTSIEYWAGTGAEGVSGGLKIDVGYINDSVSATSGAADSVIQLGYTIGGTADVMALAYQTLTGTDSVAGGIVVRQH